MAESNQQAPCLVQTPQGVTILYKNKFLYSKYNPLKQILQTIENLQILPGTIILCCSPVLEYGLLELSSKLPENCICFICEPDPVLYSFIKENIQLPNNYILLEYADLYHLPEIINKKEYTFNKTQTIEIAGNFKRVLRIDFSAGVQFNSEFFDLLNTMTVNTIKTFWTNRITLSHFGRRYSKNFFINLHNLKNSVPIQEFFNNISKPIIVCGAGQSLENIYKDIEGKENCFFILCADTALHPLLSHNIIPDGVFVDEAQHVISKAFIGTSNTKTHLFASLCSLPQLKECFPENRISYYTTIFTESDFINEQISNKILPAEIQPFGSVGLTTVYFALKFRKDISTPVYIYGLDFSYSAGFTHAKNTLAHKTRLLQNNRISPVQNYGASFSFPAKLVKDKINQSFFTTPVLENYAFIFNSYFYGSLNLFDSGECGLPLSIPKGKPVLNNNSNSTLKIVSHFDSTFIENLQKYLLNERNILCELKDILTGKINQPETDLPERIKKIVQKREYLYLHFPDGFKFQYNQSFLNRIRAEIDYFLKFI